MKKRELEAMKTLSEKVTSPPALALAYVESETTRNAGGGDSHVEYLLVQKQSDRTKSQSDTHPVC